MKRTVKGENVIVMRKKISYFLLILWTACIPPSNIRADEVVLTTGERFTSSKVWEAEGKIRFDLQGLVVSVDKADVAAVIRSSPLPLPPPPEAVVAPRQVPPLIQPSRPVRTPPEKSAPLPVPDHPASRNDAVGKSRVRGIGFDGIAWQMKPSQIPGIEKFKTDPAYGGIDQYWRPDGSLIFGNLALDGLIFGFWRDRLYSIMIWVDGKPGYERLRQVVFDRYGRGIKNEKGLERYVWLDDTTTDRMVEFDTELNTGIFWMRSRGLNLDIKRLYPE